MAAFRRGTLAAALATAMTVAPSFAQESARASTKLAAAANSATVGASTANGEPGEPVALTTTSQASDYSRDNKAVGIAVAKGKKDENSLTGERIGSVLSQALLKKFDVPSKYFVRDSAGDYTNITFFIKGRLYGPYGLDESVIALALVSRDFDATYYEPPGQRTAPNVAGKPAPTQE